jgi:hypothetical protein
MTRKSLDDEHKTKQAQNRAWSRRWGISRALPGSSQSPTQGPRRTGDDTCRPWIQFRIHPYSWRTQVVVSERTANVSISNSLRLVSPLQRPSTPAVVTLLGSWYGVRSPVHQLCRCSLYMYMIHRRTIMIVHPGIRRHCHRHVIERI